MWAKALSWLMLMLAAEATRAEESIVIELDDTPSLELLDYLGTMVPEGDKFIGPGDLDHEDGDSADLQDERRDTWVTRDEDSAEVIYRD